MSEKADLFINQKGNVSGVLTTSSKNQVDEENGRKNLEAKGWDMSNDHTFERKEDGTGVYRATRNKKAPKPKGRAKATVIAEGDAPDPKNVDAKVVKKEDEPQEESSDSDNPKV